MDDPSVSKNYSFNDLIHHIESLNFNEDSILNFDDPKFRAHIHKNIIMPLGQHIQRYIRNEDHARLKELGIDIDLSLSIKLVLDEIEIKKFSHELHGYASYSHALLMTPYKFGAAEYTTQFLNSLQSDNNAEFFENFIVYDHDTVFSDNAGASARTPFSINKVIGPSSSDKDRYVSIPKVSSYDSNNEIDELLFDSNGLATLYTDQLMPKLKSISSQNYRKSKASIPAKSLRKIVINVISKRIDMLQGTVNDLISTSGKKLDTQELCRGLQAKMCYEIMIEKGYDPKNSSDITNNIGSKALSNSLPFLEKFNSLVMLLYKKEGNRGLSQILFSNDNSKVHKNIGYTILFGKRYWYKIDPYGEVRKYSDNRCYEIIDIITEAELQVMVFCGELTIYTFIMGAFISRSGAFFSIGSEYGKRASIAETIGVERGSIVYKWLLLQQIGADKRHGNTFTCSGENKKSAVPMTLLYSLAGVTGIADFLNAKLNVELPPEDLKNMFSNQLYKAAEEIWSERDFFIKSNE